MTKSPLQTITIPLDEYIQVALGSELRGCVNIPPTTAIVLDSLTKGGTNYHVEFTETGALLWCYKDWFENDRRKQKERQKEILKEQLRELYEANMKLIASFLMDKYSFDLPRARATAFQLIKTDNYPKIKALGIHKLFEQGETIPGYIDRIPIDVRVESGTLVYGYFQIIK